MNKQSIIIYDFDNLFNILNEIKENFKFELYNVKKEKELLEVDEKSFGNYLIVSNNLKNNLKIKNLFVLENYPIKITKLIEDFNVQLLKQKFNYQSEIEIKDYNLNLNSREITKQDKKLKLTEKEIDIILFLYDNKKTQNIQKLQQDVWGYNSELETHTVETHIYRLRKKINEKFNDNNFIISKKDGYKI